MFVVTEGRPRPRARASSRRLTSATPRELRQMDRSRVWPRQSPFAARASRCRKPTRGSDRRVAPDAPAAEVEAQDVIAAVDGQRPHPGRTGGRSGPARARRERHADAPPRGERIRHRSDRPDPATPRRPLIGIRVGQARGDQAPDRRRHRSRRHGRPFGRPRLRARHPRGARPRRRPRPEGRGHGWRLRLDGISRPRSAASNRKRSARGDRTDVLLVPAGENAAEARRYAGNVRVIAVESFQQALRALATLPRKP